MNFRAILIVAFLLTSCAASDATNTLDLESRVKELEQENANLRVQLEKDKPATLHNDGVVKIKCQELREEEQYQDRELIGGGGTRSYDIYYSPVLNTCVVEQTTISDRGIWFALFDGLGEVGSRTLIEADSSCKDTEDYKCTTMDEYNAEKNRVIP